MPSVKIRDDTLAILSGLRGRFRCGHSYDALIQELVRRHLAEVNAALLAPDRLQRIEAMLVQLTQKTGDGDDHTAAQPPRFKVE